SLFDTCSTFFPYSSLFRSSASRKIRPLGMAMVKVSPAIFSLLPPDDAVGIDLRLRVLIVGNVQDHRFSFPSEFLRPADRLPPGGTGIKKRHPFHLPVRGGARLHQPVRLQGEPRRRRGPSEALQQPVVPPAAHQGKAGREGIPFKIDAGVVM